MNQKKLPEIEKEIIEGYRINQQEAVELAECEEVEALVKLANNLRKYFIGNKFDTCSIINARSGRCTADCKWCSQSMFHTSDVEIYPLISETVTLAAAKHNADRGIRRFSLVTSGRTLSDIDLEKSALIFAAIDKQVNIKLCASMGLLTKQQLQRLYDSGVTRYHCNLESAPSFFQQLCTTHTVEQKIETIRWAQQVGMEVCSGGIIGMGESMAQRVELAIVLRDLGIRSVPINLLNPIDGTQLEGQALLSEQEVRRSVAIFRIVNPEAEIRFAGGRILYKQLERKLLQGGISASIMGDMLTTLGAKIEQDIELFRSEGFEL